MASAGRGSSAPSTAPAAAARTSDALATAHSRPIAPVPRAIGARLGDQLVGALGGNGTLSRPSSALITFANSSNGLAPLR